MAVVAISKDSPAKSREFAAGAGIWFPLIADEDLAIAKNWVGVNDEGYAIPGLFILKVGGEIALRKIGERKDDRVYAGELIARLDALLETDPSSRVALRGGFGPRSHVQFRAAAAGGAARAAGSSDVAGSLSLDGLFPLGAPILLGPSLDVTLSDGARVSAGLIVKLRRLALADLVEVYVTVPVGPTLRLEKSEVLDRVGLHTGASAGFQFAVWPTAAPFLEIGVSYDRFGAEQGGAVEVVGFLLRAGLSWMP